MKLFELFNKPVSIANLKSIAEAVKNETSAKVKLGESTYVINKTSASAIYDLYETARLSGNSDKFMRELESPSALILENTETLAHILNRFPKEVKDFQSGAELDENLYHSLYDYYLMHGEMPYTVAKAREGDPRQWCSERLHNELGSHAVGADVDVPAELPMEDMFGGEEDMPELISMGMFESKKAKVGEGWDDMIAASKKRAADEKGTGKFDKKKISTGTVYTRKYNADTGETEEPTKDGEGNAPVKRGRGRPRTRPLPDPNAPKRGRGRPKKVREWIENLRYIAKGS